MRLSTRNQLTGTVTAITEGSVNASVTVAVGDQVVTSSITLEGLRELGLTEGSPVTVLVKASDVLIGK